MPQTSLPLPLLAHYSLVPPTDAAALSCPQNGTALVVSVVQETVVSESSLWFSDAAKATTSGVSELFWVSVEFGNEGGDKNPVSNLLSHFISSPQKLYPYWSHKVSQNSIF